jgi:hypothetical protein
MLFVAPERPKVPASSTSTLSLAGRLRDLGDTDLVELLTLREVRDVRLRDFFDLADALLDAASVQKALSRLDRTSLAALSAVGELPTDAGATTKQLAARLGPLAPGAELGLEVAFAVALVDRVDDKWLAYGPVTDQLRTWTAIGLPSIEHLISEPPPGALAPVTQSDARFVDHVAGEHAFGSTNAIAALLAEIQREPARELARGGIALPETKRLAGAMSVELDEVAPLVDIAARAGLAALDGGMWLPTQAASEWMLLPSGERWAHLAGAWFARLPGDIRDLLATRSRATWGEHLADYVRWLYPAGGTWMRERALVYSRDAEVLGITANNAPSTPGTTLLVGGESSAARAMAALFPPEIDKVYLQHDLTIVSTGPLVPRLDARLRAFADVESRALATTYRVSEQSVNRALASGETADSIRSFLVGISLSGIPQPLEYLIVGAAARFGSLRVGRITMPTTAANEQGSLSYVTAEDPALLSAVLVDSGLVSLGLTRVAPLRAVSRFDESVVFWSLSEARYPVAAEDPSGAIVLLDRRRVAKIPEAEGESTAAAIVRKLRVAGDSTSEETGQAWLERQIDTAVRAKLALTVTVAMPDGSTIDLQLEPASLAGGRLRARDRRSDLERTLPLSSITAVGPPEL